MFTVKVDQETPNFKNKIYTYTLDKAPTDVAWDKIMFDINRKVSGVWSFQAFTVYPVKEQFIVAVAIKDMSQ